MHENSVYLKLIIPKQSNIMGLSRERYKLHSCEYEFQQDVDRVGEVSSKVKAGIIHINISDTPTEELFSWAFDKKKLYNGEITILSLSGETLEQVYFEDAKCIDIQVSYKIDQQPNTITKLELLANSINIGKSNFIRQ